VELGTRGAAGSGIRRPILGKANVSEEDARFMIVTCSAPVRRIITTPDKAGLLRKGQR